MRSQVEYQAWIVGDEDEDDEHWTIMEYPGWESLVAKKFLQYAHSNMDGWEWMRKDDGKSTVRVKQDGVNKPKDFSFELDYEPSFYVYERNNDEAVPD